MGLPPKLLIGTARWLWTTLWQQMMAQLAPRNQSGEYIRTESTFRGWVGADTDFPPESGRYALIVGQGCPWAHRTLVVRSLKGLEQAIAVVSVSPSATSGFWVFDEPFRGCATLPELYRQAMPGYSGRCTVPVLWDGQQQRIVNNESAEIIVILNQAFNEWAAHVSLELYPEALQADIDRWNERIYHGVNNGVYRCGFAQTQGAYAQACEELFAVLDELDQHLATHRYICGDRLTLADVRLFTTLFRFDVVYYGLFKCNRRHIKDYAQLGNYLKDLYQLPGVADTCNLDVIKRDYYGNLFPLNPGGIIPLGPEIEDLNLPHGRGHLSATAAIESGNAR